jgi:hypothetical protein
MTKAKALINTKGPKEGQCNICGEIGPLTEDHTPPKGSIQISKVELRHILHHLKLESANEKGRILHDGVKYRTLCARCNNGLLGGKYDPAFNHFVNTVGSYLTSVLHLPPVMTVRSQPQKIIRAVLGHLSAQGVNRYLKGPETEPLKNYFLNENQILPEKIGIYYWAYPFDRQILIRDCAFLDLRVGEPVAIWLMKFFPIAYMVTWNEPPGYNFGNQNLAKYGSDDFDAEVDLHVRLNNVMNEYWPEAPTQTSLVMYGQEAVWAEQKKNKRKR